MRTMITVLVTGAMLLCASIALADEEDDDRFSREGGYLGMGSVFSFDMFREDDLQHQNNVSRANVHQPGYGFNVRGGWRHSDHLASEFVMAVIIDRNITVNGRDDETIEIGGTFNVKVPFTTQRFQPYVAAGMGALYNKIRDTTKGESTNFLLRGALGMDMYITENWLINVESVYNYSPGKGDVAPNTGQVRLDTVTVGAGFAYRF